MNEIFKLADLLEWTQKEIETYDINKEGEDDKIIELESLEHDLSDALAKLENYFKNK